MATTSNGDSPAAVSGSRLDLDYVKQAKKELEGLFSSVPPKRAKQVATCISYLVDGETPNLDIRPLALSKGLKAWQMKLDGSPALRVVYTVMAGKLVIIYAGKKTAQGTDQQLIRTVEQRLRAL